MLLVVPLTLADSNQHNLAHSMDSTRLESTRFHQIPPDSGRVRQIWPMSCSQSPAESARFHQNVWSSVKSSKMLYIFPFLENSHSIPKIWAWVHWSPVDCPTEVWLRVHSGWSPYGIPGGQTRPPLWTDFWNHGRCINVGSGLGFNLWLHPHPRIGCPDFGVSGKVWQSSAWWSKVQTVLE